MRAQVIFCFDGNGYLPTTFALRLESAPSRIHWRSFFSWARPLRNLGCCRYTYQLQHQAPELVAKAAESEKVDWGSFGSQAAEWAEGQDVNPDIPGGGGGPGGQWGGGYGGGSMNTQTGEWLICVGNIEECSTYTLQQCEAHSQCWIEAESEGDSAPAGGFGVGAYRKGGRVNRRRK